MPTSFHGRNERLQRFQDALLFLATNFANTGTRAYPILDVQTGQPTNQLSPHTPRGIDRITFFLETSINLNVLNWTIGRRYMVYLYEIIFGERGSFADFLAKTAQIVGMSRLSLGIVPQTTPGGLTGEIIIRRVDAAGVATDEYIGEKVINNTDIEVQEFLHGGSTGHSISFIGCVRDPATGNITLQNMTYILCIEHENIFDLFVADKYHSKHHCILFGLSGRILPAQRAWIYHLSTQLNIPVCGLCDPAPTGLSILSNVTYSESAPAAEEEFSVPIRIIDLDVGRNPNIPTGGAFQGAAFTQHDYNLLAGLMTTAPLSPFLEHAYERTKRDSSLLWMQQHQQKYQLQHVPVSILIRQTELAIIFDDCM